ncbi:MAG TPA: hypothetical protein VFY10_16790 [Dehalococcoidia bacterium]|nr:hypothetical protein [Dehalococcoidia bacterium]
MSGNWGPHVEVFNDDPEAFAEDTMVRSGWCGCLIFFVLVFFVLAVIFLTLSRVA